MKPECGGLIGSALPPLKDGYRPARGASDAQLLAFKPFVGEGAHPWVGGLLGYPCLPLGPPAGAPMNNKGSGKP